MENAGTLGIFWDQNSEIVEMLDLLGQNCVDNVVQKSEKTIVLKD